MSAAETTIDVAGNNLANSQTVGFKQSEVAFATQFLQTLSLGAAPTDTSGGTNPRQIGLGTQVSAITPEFSQGSVEISSNATDLAIQGDGFFIVESLNQEQLFTRNGILQLNSANQLVTTNGDRLLGYGIDSNFNIQSTALQPLEIPLGSAAIARATENVFLTGSLRPDGTIADTATILNSDVLGTLQYSAPVALGTTALAAVAVPASGSAAASANIGGGQLVAGDTYEYRVVYAERSVTDPTAVDGSETEPSALFSVTIGGGDNAANVSSIPAIPSGYNFARIYRTEANPGASPTFYYVGETAGTTFTDSAVSDATLTTRSALDDGTISGSYSYYITYSTTGGAPGTGIESRPMPLLGSQIVSDQRIQIQDIPQPPPPNSNAWTHARIYRNLSDNDSEFYYLDTIDVSGGNQSYTDNTPDSVIKLNAPIDLDGPKIQSATRLVDVLRRANGTNYEQTFEAGILTLFASKGGVSTPDGDDGTIPLQMEIHDGTGSQPASTVLDLINFLERAMGIREVPGSVTSTPLPSDSSGASPGGSVNSSGQIVLVGNNGLANDIEIESFHLTPNGTTAPTEVKVAFNSVQEAAGESVLTSFRVFDSLGIGIDVRVTAVLESTTGAETTYRWFADAFLNDPLDPAGAAVPVVDVSVGSGIIRFDGNGKLIPGDSTTITVQRSDVPSASPLTFDIDTSQLSGLAETSSLNALRQDGFRPGRLTNYIIAEDGVIRGIFNNGSERDLGQIVLARFANNRGLTQRGLNLFATGVNSGLPVTGQPGENGIGNLVAGAIELSNTDVGQNLIDLILASTQYRGNTRVITTSQTLFDELLNLRR
jgi:flagellar hook protein FlgE